MKNRNRFRVIAILTVLAMLAIGGVGLPVYRSKYKTYDPKALMVVTSSGGMCAHSCDHPIYNLYESGIFEGHKKLNGFEVSQLKNILDTTDLTQYGPSVNPHCESFVDGFDQVLLFPQKYGNKTFTVCMLNIPQNDKAFSYINQLLKTH